MFHWGPRGTVGPDVLHSESSGILAGGRDGTAKRRPASSHLKTDGLTRWEHCVGEQND